ncbi:DUF3068 domain-containing protein [Corynebacterium sp. MSK297]|uniref:DUF3068 domain-containing protein n=1 Tax=Corynebacterium sp. MSK297 TaxID=3050221 RepID=UPI00254C1770|nr:DUF3068 domain-containing protein [Corynebacterium sp. MSK297]MDK8845504.1 DUF3068 domain-containing protein [Corynebacterium sp. MSK297]
MLPASRVLSAIAIAIGLALVVGAGLAPRFVHSDARLPLDVQHTTFRLVDDATGYQRQLHWDLLEPADAKSVAVRVGSTLVRSAEDNQVGQPDEQPGDSHAEDGPDTTELVDADVWAFDMDRRTGEALSTAQLSHTLVTPAAHIEIDGQWLKFPVDAEKTSYDVFDETLRGSYPAAFQEEVTVDGVELYRYRQVIDPVNVASKYADARNTKQEELPVPEEVPEENAEEVPEKAPEGALDEAPEEAPEEALDEAPEEAPEEALDEAPEEALEQDPEPAIRRQLYLHHSATRDYFVHPRTGMIVDLHETVDDYFATHTGEHIEDGIAYQAQLADADVDKLITQAESFPDDDTVRLIRYIVLGIGVIITVLALIGVFGGFRRARQN